MSRNDFFHMNFFGSPGLKWGLLGLLSGWLIFSQQKTIIKYRNAGAEDLTQCGPEEESKLMYTCSMHPDVQKSSPSSCPVCGMKLVAMGQGLNGSMSMESDHIETASHQVQTSMVMNAPMRKEIQLDGFIRVDQNQSMLVTAEYPGRISSIKSLQAGSHISAHHTLGTIYSEELVAAQKEFFDATCFRVTDPNMFILARKKLRRWSFSDEHLLALENGGEEISTFPISSPFSGMVQEVLVKPGAYVEVGTPIARLIQPRAFWAEMEIFREDLSWLKQGDKVHVRSLSAHSSGIMATITYVDDWIDENKGTARVRVLLPDHHEGWTVGQYVTGTVLSELGSSVVQIPQTAILWTGTRAAVYVKVANEHMPSFRLQEVQLGQKFGGYYEVLSGLKEGEEVASRGAFLLDAEAQLSGKIHLLSSHSSTPIQDPNHKMMNPPTTPSHQHGRNMDNSGTHSHKHH